MLAKGGLIILKRGLAFFFFFYVKTIGGEPDAECAGLFPNAIKTSSQMPLRMSLRRMDVLLNSSFFFFFNTDKSVLFWKFHAGHLLVRKRYEHYDLRQGGIGNY